MRCKNVSSQLSSYLDEMLDTTTTLQISEHLKSCESCRLDHRRLTLLREKLRGLDRLEAPPYLRHLVQLRVESAEQENWRVSLRNALEYRWSKIRSTERMWFLARIAGLVATCVFFLVISAAMNPMSIQFRSPGYERSGGAVNVGMQLSMSVLKNLGLMPLEAQRRPISPSEPRINDLYLLNFGQSALMTESRDDTFSVVTMVDRSGAAKIQGVLEYPLPCRRIAPDLVCVDSRLRENDRTLRLNSEGCDTVDGTSLHKSLIIVFLVLEKYEYNTNDTRYHT
jgi:hypothetical protein